MSVDDDLAVLVDRARTQLQQPQTRPQQLQVQLQPQPQPQHWGPMGNLYEYRGLVRWAELNPRLSLALVTTALGAIVTLPVCLVLFVAMLPAPSFGATFFLSLYFGIGFVSAAVSFAVFVARDYCDAWSFAFCMLMGWPVMLLALLFDHSDSKSREAGARRRLTNAEDAAINRQALAMLLDK